MKEIDRRAFLHRAMTMTILAAGAASGLLTPRTVLAAWPKEGFDGKDVKEVLSALHKTDTVPSIEEVRIRAPEIAENGTVVPITIGTSLANAVSVSLILEGNPRPLAAIYTLSARSVGDITTRVKLAKTQNVTAVVKTAEGKLFKASKEVKVTIGGCGG